MTKDSYISKARSIHGEKYGYERVPSVFKSTDKIELFCNKCKKYFHCAARNHTNAKSGCPTCGKRIASEKISSTFPHFIESARDVHGDKFEYFEHDFKNMSTKTRIRCNECCKEFTQKPSMHVLGNGCPHCNPFPKKMKGSEFNDRLSKEHPNLECISSYLGDKEYVTVRCKVHGHEFKTKPNWLHHGHGCPICKSSLLEGLVRGKLEDSNISFTEQKRFEWMGLKSLDFFIPSLMVAVECQGIQHFKPIEFFGGEKEFMKRLNRDKDKKIECESHGILMMYVVDGKVLGKLNFDNFNGVYNESNVVGVCSLIEKLNGI